MKKNNLRQELLNKDLVLYKPKKWKINFPIRNYNIRIEDLIPALSGAIGKVALVAAFAVAWVAGFNITDPSFVTENVRLEVFLGSILTLIFCSILNPYIGPPGTLAPLIPIVSIMAASGVHPLPLGLLIGIIGLIISLFKYFSKIVHINGPGTKAGVIILFGFLGINGSLQKLKEWTDSTQPALFNVLLVIGLVFFILLNKYRARWLVIPTIAIVALVVSSVFGLYPSFRTGVGLPILSPNVWWNEKWGIGFGLSIENFISSIPFALLAIIMWPIDALAIKTIHEESFPKEAKNAVFDMNSTYLIVSLRNILGTILGGTQTAAIWRSFMIPLGIVKRPIGASAFILGILGILFGILGYPIDIAVFPPLLWLVLIFGVYIPLVEVGLHTVKSSASAQIAVLCIVAGIAVNPVLGWVASVFVENFGIIKDLKSNRKITRRDRYITLGLIIITVTTYIATYTT